MNYKKACYILILIFVISACSDSFVSAAGSTVEYDDGFSYSKINANIKKRIYGKSYKKNKDISLNDLRYVKVKYYNYKGKIKDGELIVNKLIARDVVSVFYELFEIEYPIRKIELIDEYKADDNISMEADNTSCFNYRKIAGSTTLSMHALGLAIDINPKINPCVGGAHGILPANGKLYKERNTMLCKGKYKDMMIHKNDKVYNIFKSYGFSWGGDWKNMKDYQHFYKVPAKYKNCGKYSW